MAAIIVFTVNDGYFDRFAVVFPLSRAKFDGASNHADLGFPHPSSSGFSPLVTSTPVR